MIRYKKYQMTGENHPLKGLWYARPLIEDTFGTEKLAEPQFEGQTKTKLGNSSMRQAVAKGVAEGFGTYLEEHPREAKELVLKTITAQRAREAARMA